MALNDITRRRCEDIIDQWGVELSQVVIECDESGTRIAIYIEPGNGVDAVFDDEVIERDMIAYLREMGVREESDMSP